MSALEPKALILNIKIWESDPIQKAYYEKFVECINKAEISFHDDSSTKMIIEKVEGHKRKRNILITTAIFVIVIVIGGIIGISNLVHNANKAEKEALNKELQEWCQQSQAEIDQYSKSLDDQLNEIPTPSTSNWQECLNKWNRIVWEKEWKQPAKFDKILKKTNFDGDEYIDQINLGVSEKRAFINKKNAIGVQISNAEMKATGRKNVFYQDYSF